MRIAKNDKGEWGLFVAERGDEIFVPLDTVKAALLIDQINEAACNGAPWLVYEISDR
jgi:hypothetical protein